MQEKDKTQKIQVYTIVNYKDKFLLLHRVEDIDVWEFPGGCIKFGEMPVDAAKRELKEETGIITKKLKLFNVTSVVYPNGITMQVCVFFFTKLNKLPSVKLREHKEYRWVKIEEMDKLNLALSIKSTLGKLKNSFSIK